MSQYHLEKRFGMVAVRKGYITASQLHEAMTTQLREDLAGEMHRFIGQILFDQGHIGAHQIREVLEDTRVPDTLRDRADTR